MHFSAVCHIGEIRSVGLAQSSNSKLTPMLDLSLQAFAETCRMTDTNCPAVGGLWVWVEGVQRTPESNNRDELSWHATEHDRCAHRVVMQPCFCDSWSRPPGFSLSAHGGLSCVLVVHSALLLASSSPWELCTGYSTFSEILPNCERCVKRKLIVLCWIIIKTIKILRFLKSFSGILIRTLGMGGSLSMY